MNFQEFAKYLGEHYSVYVIIVVVGSMALNYILLNLIKIPIKHFTNKIQNEKLRKLVNKSIIIISFGLSALVWWLLSTYVPQYFEFDTTLVLLSGGLPIVLYAFTDGLITEDKATAIINKIKSAISDGKVEKTEVEDIVKTATSEETTEETAEDKLKELDNLLK